MNKEIIIEEQKNSSMTNQKQPDTNKHDNPLAWTDTTITFNGVTINA